MLVETTKVETARTLLRVRALRWDYFRGDLFDEHAWNVLLVLYIAEAAQRDTTETIANQEASVPQAVGARWIAHLEQSGLICRSDDRTLIALTDHGRAQMSEYLHEVGTMFRAE